MFPARLGLIGWNMQPQYLLASWSKLLKFRMRCLLRSLSLHICIYPGIHGGLQPQEGCLPTILSATLGRVHTKYLINLNYNICSTALKAQLQLHNILHITYTMGLPVLRSWALLTTRQEGIHVLCINGPCRKFCVRNPAWNADWDLRSPFIVFLSTFQRDFVIPVTDVWMPHTGIQSWMHMLQLSTPSMNCSEAGLSMQPEAPVQQAWSLWVTLELHACSSSMDARPTWALVEGRGSILRVRNFNTFAWIFLA